MALARRSFAVLTSSGEIAPSVTLEVRREEVGSPLANIFEDRDGLTPLGNPVVLAQGADGIFFHAAGGAYRVTVTTAEGSATRRYVAVGTMGEADEEGFIAAGTALLVDANLSDVDDAAMAFENIKQAASQILAGVVEQATLAEIRSAAAGDRYLSTSQLESAAASVTLTDAATVAVDWDTFVYGILTLTANRVLGNATNVQPGTWRVIEVLGNDATERTLTFESEYSGDVPTLTDISSSKKYLLMLFGRQSSPSRVAVYAAVSSTP